MKLIATRHDATPVQVALAWLIHQKVVAIPKASNPKQLRENGAALDLTLTREDLRELDRAFPLLQTKTPLEMR